MAAVFDPTAPISVSIQSHTSLRSRATTVASALACREFPQISRASCLQLRLLGQMSCVFRRRALLGHDIAPRSELSTSVHLVRDIPSMSLTLPRHWWFWFCRPVLPRLVLFYLSMRCAALAHPLSQNPFLTCHFSLSLSSSQLALSKNLSSVLLLALLFQA